ncbi:hypothetical protein [uncultured Chryseobacterium sp.]|uniref:hypothetical protein n=1 Tax=uncultured Chryseobacterium sp. TaxID=259322 RepID=UPI0025FEADAB|nr:hypothetical protein [uncultured Chryseobacterium sp.]
MSLTEKFDRKRNQQEGADEGSAINYAKAGGIRYVSFVMLDGKRKFFCYSDLVSCTFDPEKSEIGLIFRGAGAVSLKGQNLLLLYEQLQNQLPRQIICVDKRYISLNLTDGFSVTDISIASEYA